MLNSQLVLGINHMFQACSMFKTITMIILPFSLFFLPNIYQLFNILDPCYQLPDATPQQIKKAYYNCMKACHPDLSGNDTDTTNFCMFINEVYTVRSSAW